MLSKTPDRLTFETLLGLLNLRGLYTLGFSLIFGMSLWMTFIGGVIGRKTLPRQHFASLQQRTFPIYFRLNATISSGLLFAWIRNHSTVVAQIARPTAPDVSQAYALGAVAISHALNIFWFGPATSELLTARLKLEKEEGKDAHDPNVSTDMKKLNKKFAKYFTGYGLGLMGLVANEVQTTRRKVLGEPRVHSPLLSVNAPGV